jgi:hypothetical protein
MDKYIYCSYRVVGAVSALALAGAVKGVILWQFNVIKLRNRISAAIRRVLA